MSYFDYNISTAEMQEILNENLDKLAERMNYKKEIADKLQGVLTEKQFEDFKDCGKFIGTGNNMRVVTGNFCRNRLCPVCNRRNSAQKWVRMYNIAQQTKKDFKACFALLTVTVKNVKGVELSNEITKLMKSIDRLHKRALFKNNVLGFFRSLEITYNSREETFHPHYHYIIALDESYKQNKILTYEWRTTWEQCARLDYHSQVDIKLIDDENLANSVAEVAKYSVKISSVIKENKEVLKTLTEAIKGRRLISFGGIMKEYAEKVESERERYNLSDGYDMWEYKNTEKKYERG